jgi:hypothetical protein
MEHNARFCIHALQGIQLIKISRTILKSSIAKNFNIWLANIFNVALWCEHDACLIVDISSRIKVSFSIFPHSAIMSFHTCDRVAMLQLEICKFWLEIWSHNWRFFIDVFDCLLMFSFCLFQY